MRPWRRGCGGTRDGSLMTPTVLEDVPRDADAWCREIFGPVVALRSYATFDEALAEVNDSDFGLQAGLFTRDLYKAHRAWDELEVGAVVVGDIPSWRVDHMPYGGIKGRGAVLAIEDMTELRSCATRATVTLRGGERERRRPESVSPPLDDRRCSVSGLGDGRVARAGTKIPDVAAPRGRAPRPRTSRMARRLQEGGGWLADTSRGGATSSASSSILGLFLETALDGAKHLVFLGGEVT